MSGDDGGVGDGTCVRCKKNGRRGAARRRRAVEPTVRWFKRSAEAGFEPASRHLAGFHVAGSKLSVNCDRLFFKYLPNLDRNPNLFIFPYLYFQIIPNCRPPRRDRDSAPKWPMRRKWSFSSEPLPAFSNRCPPIWGNKYTHVQRFFFMMIRLHHPVLVTCQLLI